MADTFLRSNISQNHPDYSDISTAAEKYLAAFSAGEGLLSEDYIHRHVFEDTRQYQSRVARAFTIPFMQNLITRTVNALFAQGVLRSGESLADIATMFVDATGENMAYDQFIRTAMAAAVLFGQVHTLVDYSISESELDAVKNMKQPMDVIMGQKELAPNLRMFSPIDMTNWNYVPRYGYEACVFKIKHREENQLQDWYLYVDYEEITEFDSSGAEQNKYEHNLGYCPVFTLSNQSVTGQYSSFGEALCSSQIAVANMCSIVDEIAERHAFSQLTCPDDGMFAEMAAKESDYIQQWRRLEATPGEIEDGSAISGMDRVLRRMSTSSVFTFPADTGHPPTFISPDASQLENVWKITQSVMETCSLNLGIFDKAGNILPVEAIPYFRNMCSALASFEKRLLTTALLYVGNSNPDFRILYPYYAPPADMSWMDNADRIAGCMWLSDDAKAAVIQNMVKAHAEDLLPESELNTVINGVEIQKPEEEQNPPQNT